MSSSSSSNPKSMPKDAQVVTAILKDMGVEEYEPQVVHQLLEFTYRYVTGVLEDARTYASHANKKAIDVQDVQLAVQMQMDKTFTTPPPRDMLLSLAKTKNSVPLPAIKPHCGLRLPPDRYCMTACNYELRKPKKPVPSSLPSSSYASGGQGSIIKTQIKRAIQTTPKPQTLAVPKPVVKFTPAVHVISDQQWKSKGPVFNTVNGPDEPPATFIKRKLDDD